MKKLIFCLLLAACGSHKTAPAGNAENEIILADEQFSLLSKQKGVQYAFLHYIDSAGALLRPNSYPIIGADAWHHLQNQPDGNFTLTWQPQYAAVAASADLGYTFGTYTLTPANTDSSSHGTYVTIWKKQTNGQWKFVLDSGNEGLGK